MKSSNSTSKRFIFLLKWDGETRPCRALGQFQQDSMEDWGLLGFWSHLGLVCVCVCGLSANSQQKFSPTITLLFYFSSVVMK